GEGCSDKVLCGSAVSRAKSGKTPAAFSGWNACAVDWHSPAEASGKCSLVPSAGKDAVGCKRPRILIELAPSQKGGNGSLGPGTVYAGPGPTCCAGTVPDALFPSRFIFAGQESSL